MKRWSLSAILVILLACCVLAVDDRVDAVAAPHPDSLDNLTPRRTNETAPLIVHEWGTFTSYSGSDGVKLEFRPLVDNDLPGFVVGSPNAFQYLLSKNSIRAIQRMETPVTYFYTPVERDVSVRVEFPDGLLTENFPPVHDVRPKRETAPVLRQDTRSEPEIPLENGLLDWGQVHLIPTTSLRAQVEDEELSRRIGRQVEQLLVEPARGFPHYFAARNTDSAVVQVRHGVTPNTTDYFEKFLFYRGLGNFELPLTLSENDDGTFQLVNTGTDEVRSVFLISVKGSAVRFRRYDVSKPHSSMPLQQSLDVSDVAGLSAAVVMSLIDEGLYEKEARAMVACWQSSWFGEEGTRLLYMVPTSITNTLLPLHVSPQPDEMVRILVGRMEIMPKSQEQHILQLVKSSTEIRPAPTDPAVDFVSPAMDDLKAMGRLAEPALVRVESITNDDRVRGEARRLLEELRSTEK